MDRAPVWVTGASCWRDPASASKQESGRGSTLWISRFVCLLSLNGVAEDVWSVEGQNIHVKCSNDLVHHGRRFREFRCFVAWQNLVGAPREFEEYKEVQVFKIT